MKKSLFLTVFLLRVIFGYAQPAATIADSLKEDASSVLRDYKLTIEIKDIDKVIYTIEKTITVLKQDGINHAFLQAFYDDSRKITNIDGEVLNASGKEVEKLRNRHIKDLSVVPRGTMIADSRVKMVTPGWNNFPYTVKYTYTVKMKNLFDVPDWIPMERYNQSLEKASLRVLNESGSSLRYKPVNMPDGAVKMSKNDEKTELRANLRHVKAMEYEAFAPPPFEQIPHLLLVLEDFEYDGYRGSMASWKTMGQWNLELNQGREQLPEETRVKLSALTDTIGSMRQKVKAAYHFMQNNSRYVSIQLGIGGWQPFSAKYVDEKGYGDCKALSFYMKSLLRVIDIPSFYTLVYAGDKHRRVDPDFPNQQFNHVILAVPDENDTIWLECTNMTHPFDYLGSFTHDRYALMVTPQGGKLTRTPKSPMIENSQVRTGSFQLKPDGTINGKYSAKYSGLQYGKLDNELQKGDDDLKDMFYKNVPFSACTVREIHLEADKSVPSIKKEVAFRVDNYASQTGRRLFLQPNLINVRDNHLPEEKTRNSNIWMEYPRIDMDTLRYEIPEGYHVEHKPDDITVSKPFGEYSATFTVKDSVLTYVRRYRQKFKRLPAKKYSAFAGFMNRVAKADKRKLVLVKD